VEIVLRVGITSSARPLFWTIIHLIENEKFTKTTSELPLDQNKNE